MPGGFFHLRLCEMACALGKSCILASLWVGAIAWEQQACYGMEKG